MDVQIFLLTVKIFFQVIELESEMVGARLDNVYLDKELAGRIQQIQLLLAANTPADVKEKMWSQIESEMCLQRSKTIAQMCRTKQVGWHHLYLRKSDPHPRQEVKGKLALAPATERMVLEAGESVANGHTSEAADTEEEGQERRGKQVIISTIYHTVPTVSTISIIISTCAGAGAEEPC